MDAVRMSGAVVYANEDRLLRCTNRTIEAPDDHDPNDTTSFSTEEISAVCSFALLASAVLHAGGVQATLDCVGTRADKSPASPENAFGWALRSAKIVATRGWTSVGVDMLVADVNWT